MKAKVSCRKRFHSVSLNKVIQSVLAVSILILLVPEPAYSESGALKFSGSLTQASCDARPAVQVQGTGRVINVTPQVAVDISTLNNACNQSATSFTARYQALPAADHTVDAQQGVVILTYE